MVIDQSKCVGCGYCTLACQAHNDVNPEIQWNRVTTAGEVAGKTVFLPRPCMNCAKAPCVEVCPVKASYYRSDGIVMMDYDRCIGCRYCEAACPYQARSFNWKSFDGPNPAVPEWGQPEVARRPRGVVEKCAFCYQRVDRGLALGLEPGVDADATPACCVVCPTGARVFGDLNDPELPGQQAGQEQCLLSSARRPRNGAACLLHRSRSAEDGGVMIAKLKRIRSALPISRWTRMARHPRPAAPGSAGSRIPGLLAGLVDHQPHGSGAMGIVDHD